MGGPLLLHGVRLVKASGAVRFSERWRLHGALSHQLRLSSEHLLHTPHAHHRCVEALQLSGGVEPGTRLVGEKLGGPNRTASS